VVLLHELDQGHPGNPGQGEHGTNLFFHLEFQINPYGLFVMFSTVIKIITQQRRKRPLVRL
jgi:hypothetical protein